MEVPLKIGDVVSIKSAAEGGTLEGEGILDQNVMLCSPPCSFDNCLFQICVRTRVTAAEEYAELEEKHSKNAVLRADEHSKMQLATLKRVRDKEVEMNQKTMQDKMGQTIHYGEVIQLRHLRSQKFLTVSKTDVANVEPENFQVGLETNASTLSWFTLKPSAAFHGETDPVVDSSELFFCVTIRDEEYLHMSRREYNHMDWLQEAAMNQRHPNHNTLEINSSLEKTSWKMSRYSEVVVPARTEDGERIAVNAGDIVAFFDPESRSYACCLDKFDNNQIRTITLNKVPADEDTVEQNINSAGLFVVEQQDESTGGPIEWNTPIVLRQLNSGRFLTLGNSGQPVGATTNRKSTVASLEFQPLQTAVVSEDDMAVYGNEPIYIRRLNRYMKAGDAVEDSDDRQAVVISALNPSEIPTDAQPLVLQVVRDPGVLVDVLFGNVARPRLEVFAGELKRLREDSSALINQHVHFEAKCEAVSLMMKKVLQFTVVAQEELHGELNLDGPSIQCLPNRQRLLQEQGILKQLMDIVEDASFLKKQLDDASSSFEPSDHHNLSIIELGVHTIDKLCEHCFNALRLALARCPANQLYLGDRFSVLLSFVGSGSTRSVMGCITQMLDNLAIQQERVKEPQIELFIEMLRKKPLNAPILNVFTVMCTCNGVAVEDNQCLLSEKLLQENADMLVQLKTQSASNSIEFKIPGSGLDCVSAKQMTMKQIAFLSGQLYLLADMCYDRNYIAIREAEKLMSAEVVVSCIKSTDLPAQLRSAFVRLMTHLYVDRMPQRRDRIRNLTFPWKSIGSNAMLGSGGSGGIKESTNAGAFNELQQTISNHIAGKEWTSLTEHLVGLMLKLLQFKCYNGKFTELKTVLNNITRRIEDEVDDENDIRMNVLVKRKTLVRGNSFKGGPKGKKRGEQDSSRGKKAPGGSKYHPGGSKIIPTDGEDGEEGYFEEDLGPTLKERLFPEKPRKRVLKVINSFRCISFMVGLTVVALVIDNLPVDLWTGKHENTTSATTHEENLESPVGLLLWNYIVFAIFACELILRLWAMCDMVAFMKDPFCVMDFLVVALDIVVFCAESAFGDANPKMLRTVRVFRLTKLAKVMRLMKKLRDEINRKKDVPPWFLARKFTKNPKEKLLAMTEMVRVLFQASQIEQRFKLEGLLKAIKTDSVTGTQLSAETFSEGLFAGALESCSSTLSWGKDYESKDNMLLHLILYDYPDLVQVSLSTLMLLHSGQGALIADLKATQLLTTKVDEDLYELLEEKLDAITTELESFELWGTLETDDDIARGHAVKSMLNELTSLCRTPGPTYATGGAKFETNTPAQNMLKNLETMQAYLQWRDAVPYPGPEDKDAEAILSREIRLLANKFLKWWIADNELNQDIAFDYLESHFVEDLRENVAGCAAVMQAILHGNERLIKLVPPNFVDVLCGYLKSQPDPDALSLLASLTQVGRTPLKENQIKVMILLTHPAYKADILYLCNDRTSADYAERAELMKQVRQTEQEAESAQSSSTVSSGLPSSLVLGGPSRSAMQDPMNADSVLGHLPTKIQYHIHLLELLSACAAGGINIVEAKVQNLYPYGPLLDDLNDPNICMDVRIALAKLMFEAVVEVQVPVENLCEDMAMWNWLLSFPQALQKATVVLTKISKLRSASQTEQLHTRHHMTYTFECVLPSITHFFSIYYDDTDLPDDPEVQSLPKRLALAVSAFHEAVVAANIPQQIVSAETATVMKPFAPGEEYVPVPSPTERHRTSLASPNAGAKIYNVNAIVQEAKQTVESPLHASLIRRIDALSDADEVQEAQKVDINSLLQFLKTMPRLDSKDLPRDIVHLRLEPLLKKLVSHVLMYVNVQGDRKTLDARYVQTTVWTINLFRKMIEYDWNFTVDERDDEGDDDSDDNVRWVQDALDDAGATAMCLDLIAKGLTMDVKNEAVKLLMAMLFQEGGNEKVQSTIYRHLSRTNSDFFFVETRDTLNRITHYHQSQPEAEEPPPGILLLKALQLSCEGHFLNNQDIAREQPDNEMNINLLKTMVSVLKDISRVKGGCARGTIISLLELILELLQGPCLGNQECLCHQTDLLETMNRMMRERAEDDPNWEGAEEEEQEEIQEEIDEMKTTILCIFKAVLEGQGNGQPSAIYRRVLSVLHLEVLQTLLNPPSLDLTDGADADNLDEQMEEQERLEKKPLTELQVQSLVLIKMLTGYNPSLQAELTLSESVQKKMGTEVISIEVVWNGNLEKRYFHVPSITIRHLSKSTMDSLVENVDRENQDKKLSDFVDRAKKIMEELEHQEALRGIGLARLFSRENSYYVTWVTFIINLGINIMYLFNLSYVNDDSNALTNDVGYQLFKAGVGPGNPAKKFGENARIDEPGSWLYAYGGLEDDDYTNLVDWKAATSGVDGNSHQAKVPLKCISATRAMHCYNLGDPDLDDILLPALNWAQIIFSVFTLVLFLVVRAPISFKLTMKETGSTMQSFLAIFTQDSTSYYILYVAFAILGKEVSPLYNTLLLLDILMKLSTARDVLLAVWIPIRPLMATLCLGIFLIYIFTFMIFTIQEFRGQAEFLHGECDTLYKCLLWALGFGMRNGGGYADYLNSAARYRLHVSYILDFLFFVIIIIIIMSIIFGIIIDTFGSLREEKKERKEDTTEVCFICGIDKSDFDQLGGRIWQKHIKEEHNMWAYLKFMVFIWQQDQDDDDGLEQYVRGCLETNDLRWYPKQRSMRLDEEEDEGDEGSGLLEAISEMKKEMAAELARVQAHTSEQYRSIMDEIQRINELAPAS